MCASKAIADCMRAYVPNDSVKKNMSKWGGEFQERMESLVKELLNIQDHEEKLYPFQCRFPHCVIGTTLEMFALRDTIKQIEGIFTSAYVKDFEETSTTSSSAPYMNSTSNSTKVISHECSQKKYKISTKMGWYTPEKEQKCWQLFLNWFCNEKGEKLAIPRYSLTPLMKIPEGIETYVTALGKEDTYIAANIPAWSSFVCHQINIFAHYIHHQLMSYDDTPVDNKIVMNGCVKATQTEIDIFCLFLAENFDINILPTALDDDHAHNEQASFDLSRIIGTLHRGKNKECFTLEFYKKVNMPEKRLRLLLPQANHLPPQ